MKKLLSVLLVATLMISTGLATTDYNGPSDEPHVMDQPGGQPNATGAGGVDLPSLPGQAGETARQVLGTIQDAFNNGVQGLGDALQNLFDTGNETETTQ